MSTDVDVRVNEAVYPEALNEFRQDSLDFAIGLIPERWLGRDYKTNLLLDVELVVAVRRGHRKVNANSINEFLEVLPSTMRRTELCLKADQSD